MKKILALLALFAFAATSAFASIQVSDDGVNRGQFRKINLKDGVTIDDDGDMEFDDIVLSSASGSVTDFTVTTLTSTHATTTNFNVTTALTTPNTVTAGSDLGALPVFIGGEQGSQNKLFSVTTTIASGNTVSGAVTVTGLTNAARCMASLNNEPTVPSVYVKSVDPGSGSVVVSLSADPGTSGAIVGILCTEV